jgi:DNA-binding NtrC family response regulator
VRYVEMANVLVVDDSESIRDALSDALARDGHHTARAASGEEAIVLMQRDIFDIAIVDLRMDRVNGLDLLKVVKDISRDTEVIMITGYATVDVAVEAMKQGAYDFVTKPVSIDELLLIVDRALEKRKLADSVKALQTQVKERYRFTDMVGNTPVMLTVFALIERICQVDSAVLITGESGTGKELVARAIHVNGPRRDRPFVPVNCAALPEDIQESELFGHIEGAFTGAISSEKGLFEEAHGGTVFLDEIVDASPATQAKLLRFLENGEIRRVGENTPIHVDVRLIAATSRDISEAVKEKVFREDLYYRINVIKIHLPPLRERKDDIPLLAHHFVQKYARKTGSNINRISQEALSLLMRYDWPGNVRELQNAIRHAVALTSGGTISPSSLPPHIQTGDGILPQARSERMSLYEVKKAHILQMLEEYSWDCAKAAAALGIGRTTIYRKLKEYGLTRPSRSS